MTLFVASKAVESLDGSNYAVVVLQWIETCEFVVPNDFHIKVKVLYDVCIQLFAATHVPLCISSTCFVSNYCNFHELQKS